MYTLYGSLTSPFARRIRMLMEGLPYEFKNLDIYSTPEDIKVLKEINPVNQIPVLVDGVQKVWDSRQIFNYLNAKHEIQYMDVDDENLLTAIDGLSTSAVSLLLLKRSNIDINAEIMFVNRQRTRIDQVLDWITPQLEVRFQRWDFHTMSLYALLDWALFRNLITLDHRPEFQAFLKTHAERPVVKATAIPEELR